MIKKYSLDFSIRRNKAADLSYEILGKGLDIMGGLYRGEQAIIKEKTISVVCIVQSINLCDQHSFAPYVYCVTFFGRVEKFFTFILPPLAAGKCLLNIAKHLLKDSQVIKLQ